MFITAQQSVQPTAFGAGGSRRVFRQFARLEADSVKAALSRPAPARVTQTIGQPLTKPIIRKEIVMIDAFSTPRNRIKTLVLLVVCGLSAIASVVVGIDDNLPGVLLALLGAIAFVLAFAHPWRITRKFMFLLLASVLGFVLFIILSIISDSIAQNPGTSSALQNLIQSPAYDALNLIFAMVCPAAFIVGAVGSVAMFIRGRHRPA